MSSGATLVVTAGASDATALAAVDAAAFDEPWSPEVIGRLLDEGLTRAWVIHRDGRAVASALLRSVAGEGELLRMAVRPELRRQGVGRRLLRSVLSAIADTCPHGVHLEVRASNRAARRLYGAEGFVEIGRRRDYYQAPQEDAVLMHWRPSPAPAGRQAAP